MARRLPRLSPFGLTQSVCLLLASMTLAVLAWLVWRPFLPVSWQTQDASGGLSGNGGSEIQRVVGMPNRGAQPSGVAKSRDEPAPLWRVVNESSLPALPPL